MPTDNEQRRKRALHDDFIEVEGELRAAESTHEESGADDRTDFKIQLVVGSSSLR